MSAKPKLAAVATAKPAAKRPYRWTPRPEWAHPTNERHRARYLAAIRYLRRGGRSKWADGPPPREEGMMNRIYIVAGNGSDTRLVRASSQAQAIRHCVAHLKASPADANDVATLMAKGVTVEEPDKMAQAAQAELRG